MFIMEMKIEGDINNNYYKISLLKKQNIGLYNNIVYYVIEDDSINKSSFSPNDLILRIKFNFIDVYLCKLKKKYKLFNYIIKL